MQSTEKLRPLETHRYTCRPAETSARRREPQKYQYHTARSQNQKRGSVCDTITLPAAHCSKKGNSGRRKRGGMMGDSHLLGHPCWGRGTAWGQPGLRLAGEELAWYRKPRTENWNLLGKPEAARDPSRACRGSSPRGSSRPFPLGT